MSLQPLRIVVFISGQGTNLQALIDACTIPQVNGPQINGRIVAVISDRAEAYGLQRAQQAHIATHVAERKNYPDATSFNQALLAAAEQYQPDLIVLSGFMRILNSAFVQHYCGRLINIHPSLLPKYKGLNTHASALAAGDHEHGCSVHFVTEELDGGPVIAQARLTIRAQDTAAQLQSRVQQLEHLLLPLCVTWFTHGQIWLADNTVLLAGEKLPGTGKIFDEKSLVHV